MNHTKMDRTPTPKLLDEAVRIRISSDNHHGVYKIRDLLKALAYCDELDKRPAKEAGEAGEKVIGEKDQDCDGAEEGGARILGITHRRLAWNSGRLGTMLHLSSLSL